MSYWHDRYCRICGKASHGLMQCPNQCKWCYDYFDDSMAAGFHEKSCRFNPDNCEPDPIIGVKIRRMPLMIPFMNDNFCGKCSEYIKHNLTHKCKTNS